MNDETDYPNTLRAQEAAAETGRPRLFDPALKQFPRAFQLGDYVSGSVQERLEWERVRAEVRIHLLRLVAASRWRDHLVLRGSVLMQWWFGEKARDPKDIDWVFQPPSVKPDDTMAGDCIQDLVELARRHPRTASTEIITSRIAQDDIWTYDRAEGRRLIFPFQTSENGAREIQMDLVWGESLHEAPVLLPLPTSGNQVTDSGGQVTDAIASDSASTDLHLWTATPALSLAWKLLWLVGDAYPQGKDYYDAILLAEKLFAEGVPLSFDLLRSVFNQDEWWRTREFTLDTFVTPYIDWREFNLAFPWIEVNVEEWERRLRTALAPTFIQHTK